MAKVKICGLSRPEDIEAVNAYGADYAGFVFFEKSKRNVGYEKAEKLLRQLKKNPNIQSVAVCVSPSREEVKRLNDIVPASSVRPSRASAGTFRSRRSKVGAVA